MDNIFVTKKQYKHFKEQWEQFFTENFEDIDNELRDIVITLNTVKGISTLFSCCGHHDGKEESEQFYIAMAVTDRGFVNLVSLFSRLRYELSKSSCFELPFMISLKSDLLLGTVPDSELARKTDDGLSWYPVWSIEGFLTEQEKSEVLNALKETLKIL